MKNISGVSPYSFPGIVFIEMNPYRIDEIVCNAYGLTLELLRARTRKRVIAEPRAICMALRSIITGESLSKIGKYFMKDHATVIHARRMFLVHYEVEPDYRAKVQGILKALNISVDRIERYL